MAAAKVRFIIGRAGSGKTRVVYEAIAENERAGRRSLLIVPDRATFVLKKILNGEIVRQLMMMLFMLVR